MRIYVIGYMGSGKTTTGRKLADRLRLEFADLDDLIERKYHITIPALFDKYDENAFRILEKKTLYETFNSDNIVIATGGGTPCFFDNMKMINKNGISIYLSMTGEALAKRLINAKRKRPLIEGKNNSELSTFILTQLDWREPYYRMAKIIVNGDDPNVDILINKINGFVK